jgi:tetratricopeptide (TPR) repeat protein
MRRWLLTLVLLAGPASAGAAPLDEIRDLLDLRSPDAARRAAEKELARAPRSVAVLVLHARACEALGRDEDALADYDAALTVNPDHVEALARRGLLRVRRENVRAGLADAEKALKGAKDHAIALKAKGMALFYLRQRVLALGVLDRAVAVDSGDWESWYYRAIVRLWREPVTRRFPRGRRERPPTRADVLRSIEDLGRAIAAEPDEARPYESRGDLRLLWLEDPAPARADYDRAIELRPDRPQPYFQRGLARLSLGDCDGSVEDFLRFLKLRPGDAVAPYNVACAHARAGRVEEALDWLEKAVVAGFLDGAGNREHLAADPDLESLRRHPRFRRLTRASRAE